MKDRSDSGNHLPRRFRLVLLHLAEAARNDLATLGTKPERSIHAIRTRMKNLRAILRLVKARVPPASRRTIDNAAKSLKNAFSAQRDAHVVATLRAKLTGRPPPASNKVPQIGKVPAREVALLIRAIGELRLNELVWGDVLKSYERCYRRGRRAWKVCLANSDPKPMHQWRGKVKELFYQSRVLQPLKGMKRRVRQAQRLGDRLGKWNDLQMLAVLMEGGAKTGSGRKIAPKQKALRPAIFKAAAKLFADKPRTVMRDVQQCVKMLPAVAALCVRQA